MCYSCSMQWPLRVLPGQVDLVRVQPVNFANVLQGETSQTLLRDGGQDVEVGVVSTPFVPVVHFIAFDQGKFAWTFLTYNLVLRNIWLPFKDFGLAAESLKYGSILSMRTTPLTTINRCPSDLVNMMYSFFSTCGPLLHPMFLLFSFFFYSNHQLSWYSLLLLFLMWSVLLLNY